jgi:hypothetical protein
MALGENLKDVPVGTLHDLTNTRDELGWNVLVEEVAHRIDEYLSRSSPVQRLFELLGNKPEIKSVLEGMARHATEAFRERLGVTELAPRAHLRAASHRVPGRVRPFDRRAVAHPNQFTRFVDRLGQTVT